VFAALVKKNEVNFKRQDSGYTKKTRTIPNTFELNAVAAKTQNPEGKLKTPARNSPRRWRKEVERVLISEARSRGASA